MQLRPGQRIELVEMPDDPNPIEPGAMGTVRSVAECHSNRGPFLQVDVDWDNGRSLMLSIPPDKYRIIDG